MSIYDLLCEKPGKLSMGRVSFWFFFFVVLYRAIFMGTVDPSLQIILAMLFTYNGYKKVPSVLEASLRAQRSNDAQDNVKAASRQKVDNPDND